MVDGRAVIGVAFVLSACSYDWGRFDPRVAGAGGGAASASSTAAGGTGGIPGAGGSGAAGGTGPASGGAGAGSGGGDCYSAEVLADGPVGYFRLGESAGPALVDEMSALNGSYVDAVSFGAPGAIACNSDTAVSFNGQVGYADAGARFEFAGGQPFTVEAWAKFDIISNLYRPILTKEFKMGTQASRQGYALWRHGTNGLAFEFLVNGNSDVAQVLPGPPVSTWFHVAGTYDGSSTCIYVNGTMIQCEAIEAPLLAHPGPFRIGSWSETGVDNFAGTIDEVAIYDKVLSQERIAAHFAAGLR
jgi:hypothetical protein